MPDVRALLATDNPLGLLALGQMFSPELAQLDLQADGSVVEIASGSMPGVLPSISLAMGDKAIALAVGDGLEARLPGMLAAKAPATPPILTISYDYDAYVDFVSSTMQTAPRNPGRFAPPPELMAEIIGATHDMADRISMDVLLTEQGVELQSRMTW